MPRRLAAIMYTDLVGFTASAQANEADALARLREQEGIVRPLFEPFKGREIKSTGDGFLVEFESALGALECAVEIQQRIRQRNSKKPGPPLELRVGLHVGDVEESGGDIFGDAVNVASRIVPLAEPGGVCLSGQVFDHVQNKVAYRLDKLAARPLKGVRGRMDVYRVVLPWASTEGSPEALGPVRIAVLPLANISPNPKDEYFADGLTEELITTLSQLHELRVIARTSVVPYKSAPKPIPQIGADLGVSAVLEGSVRKVGDQLRITVQLIDVGSQEHTWADTYDRKLDDVFSVQADVAKQIASVLKVKLRATEATRLEERPTVRPESYMEYLKGRNLMGRSYAQENFEEARRHFRRAIEFDDRNAAAYSGLSHVTLLLGMWFDPGAKDRWEPESRAYAVKALELDPYLAEAHASMAEVLYNDWKFAEAKKEFERALSLNPSYALARHSYASLLMEEANPEEALRQLALAEESDPHSGLILTLEVSFLNMLRRLDEAGRKLERLRAVTDAGQEYFWNLSYHYLVRSEFARALEAADRAEALRPGASWRLRAHCYARMGEVEKARSILQQEEGPSKNHPFFELALAYGAIGDLENCFRFLEKACDQREAALQEFRNDPTFEGVRRDPRFDAILKKLNVS